MFERGTILSVSLGGGSGRKPRPAVVVQASDLEFPDTVIVTPLTGGERGDLAIKPVFVPDAKNGLLEPSSLMTQRIASVRKFDVGNFIGMMSEDDMERVDAALALVLGLDRS